MKDYDSKNEEKLYVTVDEAKNMLGVGKNLMLELVKVEGFPALRFKRKILINKKLLSQWFEENCGQYGDYSYKKVL